MKMFTRFLIQKVSGVICMLLLTCASYGAVFTATSSGNFSSSATWMGGIVPPSTLSLGTIVIPMGVNVNLDQDLTIDGALAQLTVAGSLTTTSDASITLEQGTIAGTGAIQVNGTYLNAGAAFLFTGSYTTDILQTATDIVTTADIMVNEALQLADGILTFITGGSLGLNSNATIVIDGGLLSVEGAGAVGLSGEYNVSYINQSSVAGLELSGEGLQDVMINVNPGNTVTLTSDLVVDGTLSLVSGILILGENDLDVTGDIESTVNGMINSTGLSDISILTEGQLNEALNFSANSAVNDLIIAVGATGEAIVSGNVVVNGVLDLASGVLNFENANLTLNGDLTGEGSLSANSASNLIINTAGGLTSALNFATDGQILNDLIMSVGAGNAVSMASDLVVDGTLGLNGGSNLELNDNALTLGGTVAGTGSLIAEVASDLVINAAGGIPSIPLVGEVGDFVLNTAANSVSGLTGDLEVNDIFNLQEGILDLNGYDLSVMGNIAAAAEGMIASTAASDILVQAASSLQGALNFAASANTIGNLIVNIAGDGMLELGTNATIADALQFVSGYLDIGDNVLSLAETAQIIGADLTSYVITEAGGLIEAMGIPGIPLTFPVGTLEDYIPAIITLNPGSASGMFQLGVVSDVLSEGTIGIDLSETESLVDATWHIHSTISSGLNMNLEVMWPADLEVNGFDQTEAFISHFFNGDWDLSESTSANAEAGGMFSLERSSITSLSPFAIFEAEEVTATEESEEEQINIYPNPTMEYVTIENISSSTDPVNMEIYNSTGQVVSKFVLKETMSTVSVSELSHGNYFIKFYNNGSSQTRQLTKL